MNIREWFNTEIEQLENEMEVQVDQRIKEYFSARIVEARKIYHILMNETFMDSTLKKRRR